PCNRAEYVKDVTVPDGTVYTPGVAFTKTWQLKNTGSCEWSADYRLIFASGKQMDGRDSVALPGKVRPGESVNLSIDLVSPSKEGKFRGYWMLRATNGEVFGIGGDGEEAFWVEIRVFYPPDLGFEYDFASNYCIAAWRSGAGKLACPTTSSQEDGSINLTDRPVLENGRQENEFTLIVNPEQINNGYITGTYPVYRVNTGDHFLADIGCLENNQGCDVTFFLDGILSDGKVLSLGAWNESYDGRITRINLDLSSLNGQNVRFVLGLRANSRPGKANAFWLVPSIRAVQATPTPTRTNVPPTITPTPGPTQTPSPTLPSVTDSPAADAARRTVAAALGIDPDLVVVRSIEAAHWTDTCFGVATTDQNCAPASVDGFKIGMSVNNSFYEAHTNLDGSIVYWFAR
ncbi:MAG TPA: NBR1-Ig-like domain-containing protein, partial [Anaerolineales bacterium]|nr:NBR1-Ig-like domain-containing protein [Anaerolineales bacterium]